MSDGRIGCSGWDVVAWAESAARLFPEVESIHLVGSRAGSEARPTSDWDVVICLGRSSYDSTGEPLHDVERRLTFAPELFFEGLDLFFLRPGNRQVRWDAEVGLEDVPNFEAAWWQEGQHAACLYGVDLVQPLIATIEAPPLVLVSSLRRRDDDG